MSLQIYDTLHRCKVDFEPLDPHHVRLYACGPTVYGNLHIGNARPLVVFDVVYRHLRRSWPRVTYVRNITDIDDKIIKRAAELGEVPGELAQRFTTAFHEDTTALGCLPPDVEPRVTQHLPEIIALIQTLVARDAAYAIDGDVYYAVASFADYGQLSGQPLEQLEVGARVEVDERKRSPLDFALWKSAKPNEPSWPSPWGPGRPGWHIECSAMAERYLGPSFDIHGGGVDLIFPHHENERAQSQGARGRGTFARFWMHNGFVNFNDKKISKSDAVMRKLLESAFLIRVVAERHGGEALRWLLLATHYRNPINFELAGEGDSLRFPGLEDAEGQLEYGYQTRRRLSEWAATAFKDEAALAAAVAAKGIVAEEARTWLHELDHALDDDFNTAVALAKLLEGLTVANRILDGKLALPKDVKRRTLVRLHIDLDEAARALGLLEAQPRTWLAAHRTRRVKARGLDVKQIEALLAARTQARATKDFATSDALRLQLGELGVEVMDTPTGTQWRVADLGHPTG